MTDNARRIEPMMALWRFFASIRLTVVLLLSLATTSIIGTLIPQNMGFADYVAKYGVQLFRIFSILDLFDMYHAPWFRFLLFMLTLNVLICSIDRLPATLKIVFAQPPTFNANRFRRLPARKTFDSDLSFDRLVDRLSLEMKKKFSYLRVEPHDQSTFIFAERQRWTRFGFYLVHISVVLLLLGGLIGSVLGFDGFVQIPEGETIGQIHSENRGTPIPLGFDVRCDDFSVTFYNEGKSRRPKEFRSRLTIIEDGKPVLTRDIIVNDPLRYKGINFFQSSYGALAPESAKLLVKSQQSGLQYPLEATMGRPLMLPEDGGTLTLIDFVSDFRFKGVNLGETLVGRLVQHDGAETDIVLPVRFQGFDKMRGGRFIFTIDTVENKFYTGLQVTKDPGVWMVYIGFIFMIGGCFITFFMSHQKVCVEISTLDDQQHVLVSGTANKNKLGMNRKVEELARHLQRAL